ncbi:MAG: ATP-binding protein [Pseudomonadota bacterium]
MIDRLRNVAGRFSIRAQIVALVLFAQMLAHAVTITVLLSVASDDRKDAMRLSLIDGFASTLAVLDPTVGSDDPRLTALAEVDPRVAILAAPPLSSEAPARVQALLTDALADEWAARAVVRADPTTDWPGPGIAAFALGAPLEDGPWLWFTPEPNVIARMLPQIAATGVLLVAALPIALLGIWTGMTLISPVRRLAEGARRFARDVRTEPLPVEGPREVRDAIRAFNAMQARLRSMIDGRAITLASIGHDMRTPLTRLRLRLDASDLGSAREGVDRDLAVIGRMIDEGLKFMRSETRPLSLEKVDVAALTCDAVSEARLDCPEIAMQSETSSVLALADADLTRRALDALLDNAARYGGGALVSARIDRNGLPKVIVADGGPGIPADARSTALRPFHRLDTVARGGASHTEGFGIGLATAKDIMERLGGALELSDTPNGGLTVTLTFEPAS